MGLEEQKGGGFCKEKTENRELRCKQIHSPPPENTQDSGPTSPSLTPADRASG